MARAVMKMMSPVLNKLQCYRGCLASWVGLGALFGSGMARPRVWVLGLGALWFVCGRWAKCTGRGPRGQQPSSLGNTLNWPGGAAETPGPGCAVRRRPLARRGCWHGSDFTERRSGYRPGSMVAVEARAGLIG